jgi:hypothetical protein
MNPALRAMALLVNPAAEWPLIEREAGGAGYLMTRYVAVLALVPALFGLVGACLIGAVDKNGDTVTTPLTDGMLGAISGYVAAFVTVFALGLIINMLAPQFGGQKNFANALKLAVYSFTPVWLAGIFAILPGLRFLTLFGFYGVYMLAVGLSPLMKSSEEKSLGYTAVVTACACVLIYAAATAQRTVFGSHGF